MHPEPDRPGPHEPSSAEAVPDLREAGRRLVDALTEQLAAGQVETLYSLQTAAAQLRRHTAAVTGAGETLAGSLSGFTERITAEVQQGFAALVREAQTSIGEQLTTEVDTSTAELRSASQSHAEAVAAALEATSTHLTEVLEGAVRRTDDARQGLEWVAQQGSQQLVAVSDALAEKSVAAEAALTAAGEQLVERVAAAGAQAAEQTRVVGAEVLQQLRDGLEDLVAQAGRAREEVEQLVARTDATVGQSLAHLRAVADALLERDAMLERQRADEFARVLETVLQEGGAGTKRLRERIFRGMAAAKEQPPTRPAPEPAPPVVPEPPAAEPVVPRPARKAAATPGQAPVKAGPQKATAKKAAAPKPAKQAAAPKKSPAKRPAKAAPELTPDPTAPVTEEQA